MINKIFKMLNSREMAMLRVFYQQSTVINRLGMARNWNRHSAFLKWFLDPEEYHGMGYEPLRLLLRLYCSKWGMHAYGVDLTMKILAGDYKIDIIRPIAAVEASTRKLINDNSESKKPIDIWMVVDISCEIDGDTKKVVVPILVKNKTSKRKGKYQTFDYFSAGITYEKTLKHVCKFVNILLSPDGKAPRNSQYAGISYQELLDYVIEPAQVLALDHAKTIINAYINNLSSIEPGDALAISREERSLVTRFMKEHGELVHMALAAAYPGKSTAFAAPEQEFQENDKTMLLNVWNENEDILMRVICVSHPEKINKLGKLFKGNFRDNTKYRVFHRGKEIYAGEQLSKVNAAIAIFKA